MDSRFRLCGGGFSAEGRGWVPAYARTTGGGMGSRFRLCEGTGGGMGMGPRIREDNGWGVGSRFRLPHCHGAGGWGWAGDPASARGEEGDGFPHPSLRGQASPRGDGDGSPHTRGQREGDEGSRFRLCGGGLPWGDGDGSPHPRGQRVGMGSRIRLCGGRFSAEGRGWVPAYARTTGGDGGTGGSRTAPTEGEYCRARGSPPSPVFTRAGSNLPPSRGKGFVGDERAIFIVMTCGGCAALRSEGGREGVVVWVVQLWHSESVR